MASIDGVHLPDNLVWVDEFSSTQVAQTRNRSLTGALIVQTSVKIEGRPMTLNGESGGWVTRLQLADLRSLFETNPDKTFQLDYRGTVVNVIQDAQSGPALSSTPIIDYEAPTDDDWYWIQLKLLTI